MNYGFVKTAALSPPVKLGDCSFNIENIQKSLEAAASDGVRLAVFPELSVTGYSCGDLFFQSTLIEGAKAHLLMLTERTAQLDIVAVVGLPISLSGTLLNCAAVLYKGRILGITAKCNIGSAQARHFRSGVGINTNVQIDGNHIPLSSKQLFYCSDMQNFRFSVEIGDDAQALFPPSTEMCASGANIIANPSAQPQLAGRADKQRDLVCALSARNICAYVRSSAGLGESTSDGIFAAHNIIAQHGSVLSECLPFGNGKTCAPIDVDLLALQRAKHSDFPLIPFDGIAFSMTKKNCSLVGTVDKSPFIPLDIARRARHCEEIFAIQSTSLARRTEQIGAKSMVIGVSGGLDSTLTLLAAVGAADAMAQPRTIIKAVTMPCFGTSERTRDNAQLLCTALGVDFRCIDITSAVTQHFSDIGHDINVKDATFENSQARERTQVLMDLAGDLGGYLVGTGDMSELALGWATYNGDHMCMYGTNAGIPKTLVAQLVRHYADTCSNDQVSAVLYDILDTPVSPELLPPTDGEIAQKTEDIVGPYELHDFFIHNAIHLGFSPKKVLHLALCAFDGQYSAQQITKCLRTFLNRFFTQQFKRSCSPEGPAVLDISFSPRGGLQMPSDAVCALWLAELEAL